jgi:hypothetical protein
MATFRQLTPFWGWGFSLLGWRGLFCIERRQNKLRQNRETTIGRNYASSMLFHKYQAILSSTIDKYLFEVPLQQLLQKDINYKEEWIKTLESAIQNKGVKASKRAFHRMRMLMKQWLRPRRN